MQHTKRTLKTLLFNKSLEEYNENCGKRPKVYKLVVISVGTCLVAELSHEGENRDGELL